MTRIFTSLVVLGCVFVLACVISIAIDAKYKSEKGQIAKVYEGGVKDAVFEIAGKPQAFYLNRGYEGYGHAAMENLVGQNVQIIYAEKWTPLDPFGAGMKNIVSLTVGDMVYVRH
jgi:hypothetical protein